MNDGTPPVSTDLTERRRPSGSGSGVHRLNVNIANSTYQALVEIAAETGTSLAETIRRGTQLLKLIERARASGSEIQLVDPETNKVRTLELL
jgi:hypothetical protein